MGKREDSQAGFSVVEAVITVVIIGIIGVTGWFVFMLFYNLRRTG